MKKSKTVSRRDIIREIRDINKALSGVIYTLELYTGTLRNYIEFNKDGEKFTKYLEKKYNSE